MGVLTELKMLKVGLGENSLEIERLTSAGAGCKEVLTNSTGRPGVHQGAKNNVLFWAKYFLQEVALKTHC